MANQFTPEEIKGLLFSRLSETTKIYLKLKAETDFNLYLENTIYFKLYFDLSTAIEAILRGIVFEKTKTDKYYKYLGKPNDDSKAYFLTYEEVKSMIELDNLFCNIDKDKFYSEYLSVFSFISQPQNYLSFSNDGMFVEYFNSIRKTRNILAHGISSISNSAEFTKEMLSKYMYIFYLLFCYYNNLYNNENR